MEIFKTLAGVLNVGASMTLVLNKRPDGKLIVSVLTQDSSVNDPAVKSIQPFNVAGTPEELDLEFCKAVTEPLSKASGLQTSLKEYEKSLKEAAAKSKKASDEKKAAEDAEKKRKEAQKRLLDKANEAKAAHKWKDAIAALKTALTGASGEDAEKIKADIAWCEDQNAPDLFGGGYDEEDSASDEGAPEKEASAEDGEPERAEDETLNAEDILMNESENAEEAA